MKRCLVPALCVLCLLLTACGAKEPRAPDALTTESPQLHGVSAGGRQTPSSATQASFSLDDYDDDYDVVGYSDPFESWNRIWFKFNDFALLKVMKPIHKGYTEVTPAMLRSGISNFAHNLKAPIRFLNSLLQGEFNQAGVEFGYFFMNTVTSLGFAKVADTYEPLFPYLPETLNFNYTLARWGLPSGPYLVWPLFGPSSVRGTVGMMADSFMSPQNYLLEWGVNFGSSAYFGFNNLEQVIPAYEALNRMAVDPYAAVRSGYFDLMHRNDLSLDLHNSDGLGLF